MTKALACVAWLGVLLGTVIVRADDDKAACVAAHAEAQRALKAEDLVSAHRSLSRCSRPACPGAVHAECEVMLNDVADRVPTVLFAARVDNSSVTEVAVWVDGVKVADMIDGSPYALPVGEHVVRFVRAGQDSIERKVSVLEGDRKRLVEIAWSSALKPAPPPPTVVSAKVPAPGPETSPPNTLAWILAGVGVAGLATFAGFAIDGRVKQAELESGCAPHCSDSDVRSMRRSYLIGDVALTMSVVAFGASAFVFLHPGPGTKQPTGITVAWRF